MRGPGAATITRRAATVAPPLVDEREALGRSPRRASHARARPQRTRVEPRDERLDQLDEPAAQRVEGRGRARAGRGLRPRRRPQPPHQAAVHPLELAEARETSRGSRAARGRPRGSRRAAARPGGPRLPARSGGAGTTRSTRRRGRSCRGSRGRAPCAACPARRRGRSRGRAGSWSGTASIIPSGSGWSFRRWRTKTARCSRVGGDQALAEPELAAERDRLGLLRQHRVGAALEQEAVPRLGADHPAEALPRLEQDVGHLPLVERERGREPGDAAADDRNRRLRHEFRS